MFRNSPCACSHHEVGTGISHKPNRLKYIDQTTLVKGMFNALDVAAVGYLLLRNALQSAGVSDALESVVELSTPVSSFARMKEGWFLYNVVRTSPYDGNVFHQSPLLLSLFSVLPKAAWMPVFIFADIYGARALSEFAEAQSSSYSPTLVYLVYLLNPFSLLSSVAQSTNTLSNAAIAVSLAATQTNHALAMVTLALATMLSWYPLYLLPSMILLCKDRSVAKLSGVFALSLAAFTGFAYMPMQSFQFVSSQFGTLLHFSDLSQPNIGLWWYFFIEMFDFFRPFFLGAFQLFLLSFLAPLAIRFHKQPLFTASVVLGVLAVFKPYPEASDLGLYISVLVLNKQVFELMDYLYLEILGVVYAAVLGPTFYYLWIYVGSGNSNFYYAITLVYAISMILVLADSTWCAVRIDYDGGKNKKLTQI